MPGPHPRLHTVHRHISRSSSYADRCSPRPGMLLPVHSSPFSVPNLRGWYELDAHLVVSFRRSTSNGGGDISVSVNGRSACLITFSIRTQHRTRMIAAR